MAGPSRLLAVNWKSGAKVVLLFGWVVGIFPTFIDRG